MILTAEETFIVGEDTYIDNISLHGSHGVVFEDNLETGYFYAVETQPSLQVLDALHIYNVSSIVDKEKPCKAQIVWSQDGLKAALLINGYCHAVFDFMQRAGYCRNGFPAANDQWTQVKERKLTDDVVDSLFANK